MCASLLSQLKLQKVVFGCFNERFGGNGSMYNIERIESDSYEIVSGVHKQEAIDLFKSFYERGNPNGTRFTNMVI